MMKYGIIHLSSVPGRQEPSDKSEMITQLLFGDFFTIIDEAKNFIKIQNAFDKYECWICKKQFTPLSPDDFTQLSGKAYYAVKDVIQVVSNENKNAPILLGSSLPFYSNGQIKIGNDTFTYEGSLSEPTHIGTRKEIVNDSFLYLNAPYLWGGKSPFGIDCSGFTQMVYKINNIIIPRDAYQQAELGESYSFVEEAQPGDLAFFDNEDGRIVHVGILIGNNRIIHASGEVRIDQLDHQGIFNHDTKMYSHKLRVIKNLMK